MTRRAQLPTIVSLDKPYRYPKTPPFVRGTHPSHAFFTTLFRHADGDLFARFSRWSARSRVALLSLSFSIGMHPSLPTSGTSLESPAYLGSTRWSLEWCAIVHARSRRVMTTLGDAWDRRVKERVSHGVPQRWSFLSRDITYDPWRTGSRVDFTTSPCRSSSAKNFHSVKDTVLLPFRSNVVEVVRESQEYHFRQQLQVNSDRWK